MVDLQSQRHKFDLPEGLDNLMADITREVLRAQPDNIYGFIAQYLGALLRAREALTIAADERVFICSCAGAPDLDNAVDDDGTEDVPESSHSLQETSDNAVEHTGSEEIEDKVDDTHGVETVNEDVRRQHYKQDLWTTSVFSLAGSYMDLPTSRPYSVHDSDFTEDPRSHVVENLKPHHHRHPSSSSSDYELGDL